MYGVRQYYFPLNTKHPPQSLLYGLHFYFNTVSLFHSWDGTDNRVAKDGWSRRKLWYLHVEKYLLNQSKDFSTAEQNLRWVKTVVYYRDSS